MIAWIPRLISIFCATIKKLLTDILSNIKIKAKVKFPNNVTTENSGMDMDYKEKIFFFVNNGRKTYELASLYFLF